MFDLRQNKLQLPALGGERLSSLSTGILNCITSLYGLFLFVLWCKGPFLFWYLCWFGGTPASPWAQGHCRSWHLWLRYWTGSWKIRGRSPSLPQISCVNSLYSPVQKSNGVPDVQPRWNLATWLQWQQTCFVPQNLLSGTPEGILTCKIS